MSVTVLKQQNVKKVMHLFSGSGGGAIGFENARVEWRGQIGSFETICGIDADPEACEDFENMTGAPAYCMDLFTRHQYELFHGQEPPANWKEVTPLDIWNASGGVRPDLVFTSPPCQGFSASLPEKNKSLPKYSALNGLTVRGIELVLQAWEHDPVPCVIFENVPRIKDRGKEFLKKIVKLFQKYNYDVQQEDHDCGEVGGLAQTRKRHIIFARQRDQMPVFIYKPRKRKLRSIGEVIGELPTPGDVESAGPLHRMPSLAWITWLRLALIPPGKDWKALKDYADQRIEIQYTARNGAMAVGSWTDVAGTITGAAGWGRSNSTQAVGDPTGRHASHYRVTPWNESSGTITGASHVANGCICVADIMLKERNSRHPGTYKILRWDEHSSTITGARLGSGGNFVAAPLLGCAPRTGTYGVQSFNEPSVTVTASGDIHAGASAVADHRVPEDKMHTGLIPGDKDRGVWVIESPWGTWNRPLTILELAAFQSYPIQMPDGTPLRLSGDSETRWRKRIGNMVPPDAAEAMAVQTLQAFFAAEENAWWDIFANGTDIWVNDIVPNGEGEQWWMDYEKAYHKLARNTERPLIATTTTEWQTLPEEESAPELVH